MAAVDKIYGTNEQYHEFYSWCEQNYPGACNYFYQADGWENQNDRPITNFPSGIDYWLIAHCPIGWVQERLQEQYSTEYESIRAGKIQAIDLIHNEAIKDNYHVEEQKHIFDERKSKFWVRLIYPAGLSFSYPGETHTYTKESVDIYATRQENLLPILEELWEEESLAYAELWKKQSGKWHYHRDWLDDSLFDLVDGEAVLKTNFVDEKDYFDENKVKEFWLKDHKTLYVSPDNPLYYYLLYSPKID